MAIRVAPAADVISDTVLVRGAAAGTVIDVTGDAPIPPGLRRGRIQPFDISSPRRSALERYAGSRPPREPPGDGLGEPPGSRFSPYRARGVSPAGLGGQPRDHLAARTGSGAHVHQCGPDHPRPPVSADRRPDLPKVAGSAAGCLSISLYGHSSFGSLRTVAAHSIRRISGPEAPLSRAESISNPGTRGFVAHPRIRPGDVGLCIGRKGRLGVASRPLRPIAKKPAGSHAGARRGLGSDVKSRGRRERPGEMRRRASRTGKGHAGGEGTR